MTYAELERVSNQLARVLKDGGARKGDRIGIYLKKSIESVISIFGTLKAGCVYVPIDPLTPVERVAYIMQNCGIRTAVSSKDVIAELDAMTEGAEARRFETELQDRSGQAIPVECSMTAFGTRHRTLALVLIRPPSL